MWFSARSRDLPRTTVLLSSIRELDDVYWFDNDTERPTLRKIVEHLRLIEATDLRHLIILAAGGRVMDGMHRVTKALLQGHSDIDAVRFESDPKPDYVGLKPSEVPY